MTRNPGGDGISRSAFLFVDDGSIDNAVTVLTGLKNSVAASFDVLRLLRNVGNAEPLRHSFLQAFRLNPE